MRIFRSVMMTTLAVVALLAAATPTFAQSTPAQPVVKQQGLGIFVQGGYINQSLYTGGDAADFSPQGFIVGIGFGGNKSGTSRTPSPGSIEKSAKFSCARNSNNRRRAKSPNSYAYLPTRSRRGSAPHGATSATSCAYKPERRKCARNPIRAERAAGVGLRIFFSRRSEPSSRLVHYPPAWNRQAEDSRWPPGPRRRSARLRSGIARTTS